MLLSDFEYARPASLEEALELLMAYPDAQVLAGGQTLLNVMKLRISADQIVDIGRIDELQGISPAGEGSITLGAMSTYAQMVESADVQGDAADPC